MSFNLEHRLFVTRLYRKLLRQQFKWKDKDARQYGWNEVTKTFRTNQGEKDPAVVKDLLNTADVRYKVMMAYGDPYEKMINDHYRVLRMGKGYTKGGHQFMKYTHMLGKKKRMFKSGIERRENAEMYLERARTRKLPEHEVAAAGVLEHTRVTTDEIDLKKNYTKKHTDKEMDESDYHFPDSKAPFGTSTKQR